jgi:hypothetical protein
VIVIVLRLRRFYYPRHKAEAYRMTRQEAIEKLSGFLQQALDSVRTKKASDLSPDNNGIDCEKCHEFANYAKHNPDASECHCWCHEARRLLTELKGNRQRDPL